MNNEKQTDTNAEPKLRATYENIPDHSDLRGFSYRGPDSEEHPERNDKFEMKEAGDSEAKTSAQSSPTDEGSDTDEDGESRQSTGSGKGFSSTAQSISGGANDVDIDENDNEDVLEEVRGGLRADVPDENEYDDADAHARDVASRKVS